LQWWLSLWEEDVVTAVHTGHFLNSADGESMVSDLLGGGGGGETELMDYEKGAVDFSTIDFVQIGAAPSSTSKEETADEWASRLEREAAEKSNLEYRETDSLQKEADDYVAKLEAEAKALEEEAKSRAHAEWRKVRVQMADDLRRKICVRRIEGWWIKLWSEDIATLAGTNNFMESTHGNEAVKAHLGEIRDDIAAIDPDEFQNELDDLLAQAQLPGGVPKVPGSPDLDSILAADPLKDAMASLGFEL